MEAVEAEEEQVRTGLGFRFQRRIRVFPGVRLNLSKSGIGGSIGRTGLRVGIDAKGRKYFSIGLLGTGLSYRSFFRRHLTPEARRLAVYVVIAMALILGGVLVGLVIR
jgi:hypothetical protein